MAQTFSCPACGAPLDYPVDQAPAIRCPYCESTVVIPQPTATEELRAEQIEIAWPAKLGENQIEAITKIAQLLQSGRKIEAIKLYREAFGVGLKEAKEAVEAMAKGEPVTVSSGQISSPAFAPATERRKKPPWGCLLAALIVALLLALYFFTGVDDSLGLGGSAGLEALKEALPLPYSYVSVFLL